MGTIRLNTRSTAGHYVLPYSLVRAERSSETLLSLAERNIAGLPLHDGFLVKESVAAEVEQAMRTAAVKGRHWRLSS